MAAIEGVSAYQGWSLRGVPLYTVFGTVSSLHPTSFLMIFTLVYMLGFYALCSNQYTHLESCIWGTSAKIIFILLVLAYFPSGAMSLHHLYSHYFTQPSLSCLLYFSCMLAIFTFFIYLSPLFSFIHKSCDR